MEKQNTPQVESSARGTLKFCRRGPKGSIVLAALHRPTVKNAVNDDVYEDLIDLLYETERDSSISALVLTGSGSYFSSGADLKHQNFMPEPKGRNSKHKPVGRFMTKIISYPKLLAAAVNGPAVGIGVTLLFHCDLVWCTTTATFWTPFSRIALVPELCSSTTFPNRMGLAKANEFFLLGTKIDASTALQWNICSRIVQDVDLSGDPFHSLSLANQMAQQIDQQLLSLPLGDQTAQLFVSMVRGRQQQQQQHLQSTCQQELALMDQRFDSGQVAEAVSYLALDSTKRNEISLPRSKL